MAAQTAPFLAVVLNPKHVTVAEAQFVDDELRILTLGDVDAPAGAFDGTQLAGGSVLGRALGDFISQKQVGARDAVFILPEGSTITQLIKLPAMPHEDMLGAVRSVAERYAIFAERLSLAHRERVAVDRESAFGILNDVAQPITLQSCFFDLRARTMGMRLSRMSGRAVEAEPARLTWPELAGADGAAQRSSAGRRAGAHE